MADDNQRARPQPVLSLAQGSETCLERADRAEVPMGFCLGCISPRPAIPSRSPTSNLRWAKKRL